MVLSIEIAEMTVKERKASTPPPTHTALNWHKIEGYNEMIPYAFKHIATSRKIATFDSKGEAIKSIDIAREHDGDDYRPIILEIVIK